MVGDLVLRSQRSLLGLFPDLRLPLCSNVSCFFYEEVCPMPGLMESGSGSPSGACALSCDQTLCDPIDCSPPGSSVRGIFQAQILEWVAISFSRGSSRPRDWTCVSYIPCTGRRILYQCTTWDDPGTIQESWFLLSSGNQSQIWQWARRPEGFPHSSVSKESAWNAGDLGSIPVSERSPEEGYGNSLQWMEAWDLLELTYYATWLLSVGCWESWSLIFKIKLTFHLN